MRSFMHSSLLVAGCFGLAKVLGLVRQVLIARQFGVSPELDAFNVANNLPDTLFTLISGGALSLAIIPVLTESLELEGQEAAWALFSRIANLAFLVTGALALLIAVFALPLVRWRLGVAPGFSPTQQQLVAELMRLNLIATLLFSFSGMFTASLQSRQHFLLPALAPVLYNIGLIFGVAILSPSSGQQVGPWTLPALELGIHGLVYGVILGAALHLGIQIPGLIRYRFRWSAALNLRDRRLRRALRLIWPRIVSLGTVQLIFIATDNLASYLGSGAVSALTYGWQIMQVPETVIGTAIGTVLLPLLARLLAQGDREGCTRALGNTVRLILLLTIASGITLAVALPPLIPLVFRFDPTGTQQVVAAMGFYLLGLVGHSLQEVGVRAFYARQDARTPMLTSLANLMLFLALAPMLARMMGHPGIALTNSLVFTLESFLLLYLLWRAGWRFAVWGALRQALLATAAVGGSLLLWMKLSEDVLLTGGSLLLSGIISLPFLFSEWRRLRRM